MTVGWVDGGYKNGFLEHAAAAGFSFTVVPKEPDQKGFTPLPADEPWSALSVGSSCTADLSGTSRPFRKVPSP